MCTDLAQTCLIISGKGPKSPYKSVLSKSGSSTREPEKGPLDNINHSTIIVRAAALCMNVGSCSPMSDFFSTLIFTPLECIERGLEVVCWLEE